MPGFQFRHRLSGGDPTVQRLAVKRAAVLSPGDIVNFEDGAVDLAVSGDTALVGAALDGTPGPGGGAIRVITDGDAVYAVDDQHARTLGAMLILVGASGAHGIGPGAGHDLSVVADSAGGDETLVRISATRHHAITGAAGDEHRSGGELNAAITRAVVRLHRERTGRGPTRAHAFYRGNVIVVIMHDAMSRAESSLAANGRIETVIEIRQAFQETMRAALVELVESLTGCVVEAFMSANHIEPDMAAEIFVLDRPVPGEPGERRLS
jgi:uncharacterized protein YbcI